MYRVVTKREADKVVAHVIGRVKQKAGDKIVAAGSYRRGRPRLKDIDFITNVDLNTVAQRLGLEKEFEKTRRKIAFRFKDLKIDISYVKYPEEWPYALLHFTGDGLFNVRVRNHAKKMGYKVNQYGIFDSKTGERAAGSENLKTERQVLKFLDFPWRAPYERVTDIEKKPKIGKHKEPEITRARPKPIVLKKL